MQPPVCRLEEQQSRGLPLEGWAVIRGNNEFYLLDYQTARAPAAWNTLSDFPVLPWLHAQLHGRCQHTIAAWADTLQLRYADAPLIRVVHRSPRSAWEAMHPTDTDETRAPMLAPVRRSTCWIHEGTFWTFFHVLISIRWETG